MRAPASFLVALLSLTGCPKKDEAKPPAPPTAAPAKPKTTEVEFFGSVDVGTTKPAKSVFVVTQEPCAPPPAEVHLVGQKPLDGDKLFAEFFPPQGSKGHLCVYGLDAAGKVIAAAAFAKNPVTFAGEGEVIMDHIDLKLEPLAEPASLPKGM